MNRKEKIIYFGNHSRGLVKRALDKEIPSNAVYGFDRLVKNNDFAVEFINLNSLRKDNNFLIFSIKYFFAVFRLFYKTDIVFSTQLIPLLIFRKLFFGTKVKWVHYNINLSYVLGKNYNRPLKRRLLLKAVANTDIVVCLTKTQKDLLLKHGIKENKIRFIPFGVDDEYYQANESDKGYIFSVGRDMGRDYKTLIEFARQIKEKLIILTSPRNMENIKNIPANVEIFYNLPHNKMREYYRGAKIIIIPSKREDYISDDPISDCSGQTVILESMACGKLVITSERSWIYDYGLKNSLILYKAEDANDLLDKYNSLINNQGKRQKLGLFARKIIEEKYNIKNMANNISDLFKIL